MNRDIVDDVRQGAADALGKTEATAASAKEGILDAIGRVSEIVRTVRGFGLDDFLGTVGLQRKQSPALAVGMFGVGVACGAVLGVILAPMSGEESRKLFKTRMSQLFDKSERKVHATVDDTVEKAKSAFDDAKAKAKDVSSTLEHGVEHATSKVQGLRRAPEMDNGTNGRSR